VTVRTPETDIVIKDKSQGNVATNSKSDEIFNDH